MNGREFMRCTWTAFWITSILTCRYSRPKYRIHIFTETGNLKSQQWSPEGGPGAGILGGTLRATGTPLRWESVCPLVLFSLRLFSFCFLLFAFAILATLSTWRKLHIYIEPYSYISRHCYASLEYLRHDLPSSTRSNQICQRQYHSPKLISHRSSQEMSWSWGRAQWHPRYIRRGYGWRFLSRTWHPRCPNPCALTDRRVRRTRISSNYEGYQRSIWRTLWMI